MLNPDYVMAALTPGEQARFRSDPQFRNAVHAWAESAILDARAERGLDGLGQTSGVQVGIPATLLYLGLGVYALKQLAPLAQDFLGRGKKAPETVKVGG